MTEEKDKHLENQPDPDDDPNNPPGGGGAPGEGPDKTGEPKKPGEGEPPEKKPGEGDKDYTDEELAALIADDEGEWLESQGLGKFKSVEALVKGYKDLEGPGTKIFTAVKRIGEHYKMTPDELIGYLESQISGAVPVKDARDRHTPSKGGPAGTQANNAEIKRLEKQVGGLKGRFDLDRLFDKWQARKKVEGEEIPDSKQDELEKILLLIAGDATEEELRKRDLFEEANVFYDFRQEKRKDAGGRVKHKLDLKKKQLGLPSGRGGTPTSEEVAAAQAFGYDTPP